MLFHLDFSPLQLAAANRSELSAALAELLRAHRFGHHLVVIGRTEALWMRSSLMLSAQEKAALLEIANEYTQTKDLLRRASRYISIVPNPVVRTAQRVEIGLTDLLPHILDPIAVLVEDVDNDGPLYSHVIQNLRRFLNIGPVSFRLNHGGGSRTPWAFQNIIQERRIAAVVVDPDTDMPRCGEDPKAAQFGRIASEVDWPHFHVVVLNCREAENLLPLDLVKRFPSAVECQATVDLLQCIAKKEVETGIDILDRYWLHFDIKLGATAAIYEKPNKRIAEWVRLRMALANHDLAVASIPGFGSRVLNQLLESNEFVSEFRKVITTRAWRDCFQSTFAELVWMCAGRTPKIT